MRPDLVAQVRFTEWTADGKLRHPVYLGLRDDKRRRKSARGAGESQKPRKPGQREIASPTSARRRPPCAGDARRRPPVIAQLARSRTREGRHIELPGGSGSSVTNLAKLFWPQAES